ncbi:hypothetical protein GCM10009678_92170 [Actinomadura kijaniata]|uniref:Uncharacterized protein n=1 Tax=Actinomadura namibiensis TaxID=182080 RepID=A0A7W3QSA7_ACTNM|nr:hypothetical protein [Actinomadura namibiensis]MBA8957432.1 hypothetical protein [Actinomadura namibiensis]
MTSGDKPLVGSPTWEPLSTDEALDQIEGILSERFSLLTSITVGVQSTSDGRWLVCMTGNAR